MSSYEVREAPSGAGWEIVSTWSGRTTRVGSRFYASENDAEVAASAYRAFEVEGE